ncbi:aminotransferase class I/II-fold pyridoxal phosphate-dependent enzyme [Streptococcus suis]|uniref:Aminotransferase class I/II-fold pyridoxal phosphate-dependent enzyme n=1 Tax=Streptococcus suis TaxID=1307 RepID=A0A9Q5BR47_STRSU|nr:aminotransferase class I/II-fold pyridoxal phosphate-dependent enzyme [Streptococcus suis]MCK3848235.1 aminotransferase class I/II-fold pyridoxal phosphate-dependent enzyme [Streptococcus suis]MCK3907227.1 aminotransferase class I/II-fold pyridoxal phosphate-dependent enzyme [Streptococcus suis]MCK4065167.1 aminotransferase class I/II-fold pyridoxal phosphate-dependent enzyme [Streptococcus suis]NQJ60951.1 aminotransferase class I/II-fold pyridoxal phosphate-dependent enzyme [Streptococcus s
MKRKVFEHYQPYKIKQKARFDLGNNENRIIDWSFLPQETLENLDVNQLSFYGDNTYSELIEKYAAYLGVNPKQVTVGVGSDHLIHMIVSTFMEKDDTFLTVNPDFFMYETYNHMHGSRFEAIDLEEKDGDLVLPVENLLVRAEEVKAKIIMLSNPNNPSSVAYSLEDLEKLAISFKGLLVVDEAYIEFANVESFISRLQQFDNVLVLRTLSKAFGLAGLRVGFAIGSEELIYELDKVIPPFSLSNLTAKMAAVALNYTDKVLETVGVIQNLRDEMILFLQGLDNCQVLPSQASFVTFKAPWAEEFYQQALAQDWNFKYYPTGKLEGHIRLSIGRPEEMDMMKKMIDKLVEA